MPLFDPQPYRDELQRRLDAVRRVVDAAHPTATVPTPDVSREARGLAIVLLFAAYENLLTSMCRGLLETALALRVGNRRLKKGLRLFAAYTSLQGVGDSSENRIWRESGLKVIDVVSHPSCTLNADLFPTDGSFMKRSQVTLFCDLFELGDPGPVLKEVWAKLDTIVTERNGIAHGRLTPEEVGRDYAIGDLRQLIDSWQLRWTSFIDHVAAKAATRDFYRNPR